MVHKNIQNMISYDLIGEGKEVTVFIDRSDDEPGRCHLYKFNLKITKDLFTPEELDAAISEEDLRAEKFSGVTEQKVDYLKK